MAAATIVGGNEVGHGRAIALRGARGLSAIRRKRGHDIAPVGRAHAYSNGKRTAAQSPSAFEILRLLPARSSA